MISSHPCRCATLLMFGLAACAISVSGQAVTAIAAGQGHSMFVKADGTLWGIGSNSEGQLGDGSRQPQGAPLQVATGAVTVAAGPNHTLFVKADGTLWGMGSNLGSELGDGSTNDRWTPIQIATDVARAAAGSSTSYFVKSDGTLWAMGANHVGQIGDGTTSTRSTPVQVATGVASISTGYSFALFVKTDGTLWAMGDNSKGQLGDGTTTNRPMPIQVATGVTTASAGGSHAKFVKSDGSLWGMGGNENGQIGDGTKTDRHTPVQIATAVASVSTGPAHTMFVKTDGTLWANGSNYLGLLGDSGHSEILTPVQIASGVTAVSAGWAHTLFIKRDGTLWGLGQNHSGQFGYPLGYPLTGARLPTSPVQIVPAPAAQVIVTISSGATVFTESANAPSAAIAVDPELRIIGDPPTAVSAKVSLAGAGFPFLGEDLGFGADPLTMGNITGTYDRSLVSWTLISIGGTATLQQWQAALRAITYLNVSDTPTANARSVNFVVNNGVINSAVATKTLSLAAANDSPTDIFLSSAWVHPDAGANGPVGRLSAADPDSTHFIYSLVTGEGATDNNEFNISGDTLRSNNSAVLTRSTYSVRIQASDGAGGTYAKAFRLTVSPAGERAIVSLGAAYSTYFVTANGTLWELRTSGDRLPTRITEGVAFVPQGMNSGPMYLKRDGSLWVSPGHNQFRITPTETPQPVATDVATFAVGGDSFATSGGTLVYDSNLSTGNHRTLFVKTDGTLWGVGGNDYGQLGDGTTTERSFPFQIATDVASVTTGLYHTLFIKTDGTLWAMGRNEGGELGDGTNTDRTTPVQIATEVASVSAGGGHTLFVKMDGTLWAMGFNGAGVLGDGTTMNRNAPVQIATGVVSASAGSSHSAFVKADGTLWTMGRNSFGELGDGSTIERTTPIQIATGVTLASAGLSHTSFVKADGSLWVIGPGGPVEPKYLSPVQIVQPVFIAQPSAQSVSADGSASFTIAVSDADNPTYTWQRNGVPLGVNSVGATLSLWMVKPSDIGIYSAVLGSGTARSEPTMLGLSSTTKTVGAAEEIQADIFVPSNGHTIDQVLLRGAAAAITADHAQEQITRISFIDLTNDIVQVEMSGPGTLSLALDGTSAPALPASYNQNVQYVKGHAGIVITGATDETNVTVFTVGRATALNQSLFKSEAAYDGIADIAFIAISSANGKFGGVRSANANYWATKGVTGLYAPNVGFDGPVFIGDIDAIETALPMIVVGSAADTRITGGDLEQRNGAPVTVAGLTQLRFTTGQDSHGTPLAAKPNRAILQENGVDVTTRIRVNP